MRKIDSFVNKYSLSKTLRFSLIPIGKTEENFNNARLLDADKARAKAYIDVKGYIDEYHKFFINKVLNSVHIEGVREYAQLYWQGEKDDNTLKKMETLEKGMRKQISKTFTKNEDYKKLFDKSIIHEILPSFLSEKEDVKKVEMFFGFSTYFRGFHENRKNMYTDEAQTTAISYRCINENLPKFLDNIAKYNQVKEVICLNNTDELNSKLGIFTIDDMFSVDYFDFVLNQTGIDKYNCVLGGYVDENGVKIQGLNELINLYNQQLATKDKSKRLPLLNELYKQILSDQQRISFIPEAFESDDEMVSAINEFYVSVLDDVMKKLSNLFDSINDFSLDNVFVLSGTPITELSNSIFGKWDAVSFGWKQEYEERNPLKGKKSIEKYLEEEKNAYKKLKSMSLNQLYKYGCIGAGDEPEYGIGEYYNNIVNAKIENIRRIYYSSYDLFNNSYSMHYDVKLSKNTGVVGIIKDFLDEIKALEHILKPLLGFGREDKKDMQFYGIFPELFLDLSAIDLLYDKARNYVAKKPYSTDKIKLNFNNPQFLGGWDKNKERDYLSVILRKDGMYYLAIMDKSKNKSFINAPTSDDDFYEKVEYKLLPGPKKMLPKVFLLNQI